MTQPLDWALLTAIASLIVSGAIALWAAALQRTVSVNDRKRFMRESITTLHDTLQDPRFRDSRDRFKKHSTTPYAELSDYAKSDARRILSVYGVIARMVRHDAIDTKLFQDFWEGALLRDWDRLKLFVEGERARNTAPTLFKATEDLVACCVKDKSA